MIFRYNLYFDILNMEWRLQKARYEIFNNKFTVKETF